MAEKPIENGGNTEIPLELDTMTRFSSIKASERAVKINNYVNKLPTVEDGGDLEYLDSKEDEFNL